MKIKPCGKIKNHEFVWNPEKHSKSKVKDDKRSYDEYLVTECLKEKISDAGCKKNKIVLKDDEEAWEFDDDRVPLCGQMGIAIIKNGKMIKKIPLGLH